MTQKEEVAFLDLLKKNGKDLGKKWNLIYHGKSDGMNDKIAKQKYENKKNLVCFIHSENDDIFGGYTSNGWKPGHNVYNNDDKAFIFNIRSSKGFKPIISNIKQDYAGQAMYTYDGFYLIFGSDNVIYVYNHDGSVYHHNPSCYSELPTDRHLMGGSHCEKVVDIEIFQLT